MKEIPKEMLKKYYCYESLELAEQVHGKSDETTLTFYETFLKATDYIVTKVSENNLMQRNITTDYTDVFEAREFAREQIRLIEQKQEQENKEIQKDASTEEIL